MKHILFIFMQILAVVSNNKILDNVKPYLDIYSPLKITTQFKEMSIIVFCSDGGYEESLLIQQFSRNTMLSLFIVNYENTSNQEIPEGNTYVYVIVFDNQLSLKHFLKHLNHNIQVIIVLTRNSTVDAMNISKKLCHILDLYILDLLPSKLMKCYFDIEKGVTFEHLQFEENKLPQVENILNFQGRKFNVGLIDIPLRTKFR